MYRLRITVMGDLSVGDVQSGVGANSVVVAMSSYWYDLECQQCAIIDIFKIIQIMAAVSKNHHQIAGEHRLD
jgi:hypothetical protein